MEDEIDLLPYLRVVWQGKWIVLFSIALGAIVGVVSALRIPPKYEAVALVAVVESRDIIQFDPRFLDVGEKQPLQAFPEFATSDEALSNIISQDKQCVSGLTIRQLRSIASASLGKDSTLLRLEIHHEDPETAVCLVNSWAESFVVWANSLFGDQNRHQIEFYEAELNDAHATLDEKNLELIAFEGINTSTIISHTLSFYQNTRIGLLEDQQRIESLVENSKSLKTQLLFLDEFSTVSYADQLTFLQIQQQVLNDGAESAILLQTSHDDVLTTQNVGEQITQIDYLIEVLASQNRRVSQSLKELEPMILQLQQEQRTQLVEVSRLQRELRIAVDTAVTLAYKLEEEQLKANDASNVFRLVSKASNEQKAASNALFNRLLLGAVLSAFLAIFTLIVKFTVTHYLME